MSRNRECVLGESSSKWWLNLVCSTLSVSFRSFSHFAPSPCAIPSSLPLHLLHSLLPAFPSTEQPSEPIVDVPPELEDQYRLIQYSFPAEFLKARTIGTSLVFSVGDQEVISLYMCMSVCMPLYLRVCLNVSVGIHVHTLANAYTYTHTLFWAWAVRGSGRLCIIGARVA